MSSRARPWLCALALVAAGCWHRPAQPADAPLFVRLEDLADYGFDASGAQRAKIVREWYTDASLIASYDYETHEDGDAYLMISSQAEFQPSPRDAKLAFHVNVQAMKAGAAIGDARVVPRDDFFEWGDESYFADVESEHGDPLGNLFVARQGKKVFSLMLFGVFFDDRDAWAGLVEPKLAYLASYEPVDAALAELPLLGGLFD